MSPEERRRTIIEAARPLLVANGGRFTTKQVAEAAGIAEGTIFRVFPTKQALYDAVIADVLDPTPTVEAFRAMPEHHSLEERITAVLTLLYSDMDTIEEVFMAVHAMPSDDLSPRKPPMKNCDGAPTRSDDLRGAMAEAIAPWRDELSVSLEEAAAWLRSVAMATSHPFLKRGADFPPELAARLITHGLTKGSTRP
ncbi:MAG: TetR/AcrR family transcriptional regulator [Propionibacteriaceae bacterium]|nr:TetR/AcrR family transcriptional regulator [Propionibacteriaceae bacterium]